MTVFLQVVEDSLSLSVTLLRTSLNLEAYGKLQDRGLWMDSPAVFSVAAPLALAAHASQSLSKRLLLLIYHCGSPCCGWWHRPGSWSLTSLLDVILCVPFGKDIDVKMKITII